MRVLFGGGSTGGHLYPALAIACALRAIDSSTDALFAATANGLDRRILAASGERFVPVAAGPVSGASILRAACSLVRQPLWIAEARRVIRRFSANVVIGTGGQVSGPLLVAARLERIPTLLVELNVVPGRSNRFAVRLASAAAAGWSETAGRLGARAFVSGVPVRAAFFTVPPPTDDHRLRVAVIGGSAGSARLNRAVQQALPRLATLRDRITVVAHAAGEAGEAEMRRAYAAEGFTAEVHRYVHDMAAAYIQCNAVIAHAGASTCAELAASGRPSILVPLDASAGRHQCANADAMAAAGAAMLVCDNAAAGDDGRRCHWAAGSWSPCSDVAVGAGAGASPRRRGDCRTRNRPRRTVVSTIISSRRAYEITKPDLFRVFQLSWRARGRSLAHGVTRGGSGFVNPTFPLQFYAVDALSPYREHLLYRNVGLTVSNFGLGTVVAPDSSAAYYATVDAVYEMPLNPPSGHVSILFFLGVFGLSQAATLTGFDSTGTYFNIIDGAVAYHLFPGTQAVTVQQFPPTIGHAVSAAFRRSPWGGVRIEPHEGVTTTESGATGTFTAVLTAPPLADVSVSFSSSRPSEGAVSPASVVYTTGNWNVPRTITVTGVDDVANDGNQPYSITSTTTSVDANYSGRTVLPVSVTNLEVNHLPGLTAASHSVRQGNASATVTLGSASDIETAAGALALSSVSVPGGVTIGTIGNSNGTFTAPLSASCTAPTGAQALTLRVTDGAGGITDANATVTVLANTAPTLGAYAAATLALAAGNTVPPSVPPSDNVSVLLGVAAPGFTGSLSVDSSTGVVTIANAGPAGAYTVTVTGTDNCAATTTANFALTVPMTLSPASLSGGTEGVAYGPVTITQTGGVGPTTFAVISGALPAGMTLSSSGILSGTPTAGGTFTFTVTATGTNSATGSQGYTLTVNGRPTISALPSQTIVVNGSTVVPFSIGDDFTAPSSLVVSVGSSNPGLMPSSGLVLGGSGSNRNLTLTPAAEEIGQATITLSVNDGTLTAGAAFVLTVQLPPPNQAPTIAGLGDASMEANTSNALAFTVGDDQTAPESLAVTATSSNEVLLLNNALTLSGSGSSRALTVTPAADRVGTTTLSVTVSDGKLTTTQTFVLAVVAASAPQAPTGLTASAAGTEIRFFWNAPAAGSAPTFYVLEGGTSPGTTTLPVVNTGSRATTWTVTLPPGTYFVRVRSGNGAGTSGPSNEISGSVQTTVALPGSPTGLSIAAAGTHLTTSWQRPSVGGTAAFWQIEVGTAPGQSDVAVFAIAGTSFSASGDLPPGQYVIRVRGQNAGGIGPPSNEVSFTVGEGAGCIAPPAPPVLLPATVVGNQVTLSWVAPGNSEVTGYRLLAGSSPGAGDRAVVDLGPVTSFAAQAAPGTYYLSLFASSGCGFSGASNIVVLQVGGVPAPNRLRSFFDGTSLVLLWDPVPGAASYVVDAGTTSGASGAAQISTGEASIRVDAPPPGTFYVRVRAIDGTNASSAPSAEIVIVIR